MIDIISVDKNLLILNEISISEYFWLSEMNKQGHISLQDLDIIGKVDSLKLQEKGFLKIMPQGIVLREKAKELFGDPKNNFYRFLSTFPIKTPSGRYLSPAGTEGVAVNNLKKKWNNIFKENRAKEERAIMVLEAEIDHRKKDGSMNYMTACEAWLNGAFYEKYEYLLEDKKQANDADLRSLM